MSIIQIVLVVLCLVVIIYVPLAQVSASFWYLFCKQHKGKSKKECRNICCVEGKKCPYNTLYKRE